MYLIFIEYHLSYPKCFIRNSFQNLYYFFIFQIQNYFYWKKGTTYIYLPSFTTNITSQLFLYYFLLKLKGYLLKEYLIIIQINNYLAIISLCSFMCCYQFHFDWLFIIYRCFVFKHFITIANFLHLFLSLFKKSGSLIIGEKVKYLVFLSFYPQMYYFIQFYHDYLMNV
jgi:hypothetical protein